MRVTESFRTSKDVRMGLPGRSERPAEPLKRACRNSRFKRLARAFARRLEGALCARIRVARNFLSFVVSFLDDEIAREASDNGLDLRLFMLWRDTEVSRFGTNRLVLEQRHRDRFRAVGASALAGKFALFRRSAASHELGGDLGHSLVDLAEEGFIRGEPLVTGTHQAHCQTTTPFWQVGLAMHRLPLEQAPRDAAF